MPRDSGGIYSLPAGYLAVNGDIIQPSQHNPPLEDIASALTLSLPRNGAAPMTGTLNMGTNKISGLANGTVATDGANLQQAGAIGFIFEDVKTANYTVLVGDAGKAIIGNSATAITFDLPAVASSTGLAYTFRNINTGVVTLDPSGAELIEGAATYAIAQGQAGFVWSNGTTWKVFGSAFNLPTHGTAVTASGTSIDFTGIPSWARRVTVSLAAVSTNGTSPVTLQIGTSGGIVASGYSGAISTLSNVVATANFSIGFDLEIASAATIIRHGTAILTNITGNQWVFVYSAGRSDGLATQVGGGSLTLGAVLDRVRLTTSGGANTFDAGTVNITYEA